MALQFDSFFQRYLFRLHKRHLNRVSDALPDIGFLDLMALRNELRGMKQQINRLTNSADYRLTLPLIGSNAIQTPIGTDWSWRPEIWRGPICPAGHTAVQSKTRIGTEATVFHDCKESELTFRQVRNTRESDLAPFGLSLDALSFDGSFLSLALKLPLDAVSGLRKRNVIRMDAIVEMEKPVEIFARLNIRHGPNTEQVVRELPLNSDEIMVEYDLAFTKINETRVESMWMDLIFEGAEMNQIVLRDVTFSRHIRAEI